MTSTRHNFLNFLQKSYLPGLDVIVCVKYVDITYNLVYLSLATIYKLYKLTLEKWSDCTSGWVGY